MSSLSPLDPTGPLAVVDSPQFRQQVELGHTLLSIMLTPTVGDPMKLAVKAYRLGGTRQQVAQALGFFESTIMTDATDNPAFAATLKELVS